MTELQLLNEIAASYGEEIGRTVSPQLQMVFVSGAAPSIGPLNAGRWNGNSKNTEQFARVVPSLESAFVWFGNVWTPVSTGGATFLNSPRQGAARFTVERSNKQNGNLSVQTLTGIEFGEGWIPIDVLMGSGGARFLLDWPVLFRPRDAMRFELANLQTQNNRMLPLALYGYLLQ